MSAFPKTSDPVERLIILVSARDLHGLDHIVINYVISYEGQLTLVYLLIGPEGTGAASPLEPLAPFGPGGP